MPNTQSASPEQGSIIKRLLTLGTIGTMLIVLALGAANFHSVQIGENTITSIYQDQIASTKLQTISSSMKEVRFRMAGYAIVIASPVGASAFIKTHKETITSEWSSFQKTLLFKTAIGRTRSLISMVQATQEPSHRFLEQAISAFDDEDSDKITSLLELEWPEIQQKMLDSITQIHSMQQSKAIAAATLNLAQGDRLKMVVSIVVMVAFLMAFISSQWISTQIQNQALLLESANKVISKQKKSLQRILDNVDAGFFLVDRKQKIQEGFSKSCVSLLGSRFCANGNLVDCAFTNPNSREQISMAMEQALDEVLPADISLAMLPTRYCFGESVISIAAKPIFSDSGSIEFILFNIADVTRLVSAEKENSVQRAVIQVLHHQDSFQDLLIATKQLLASTATDADADADAESLRMMLHTLKGNFEVFGLSEISELIHKVEDKPNIVAIDLLPIGSALRFFIQTHKKIFDFDYEDTEPTICHLTKTHLMQLDTAMDASHDLCEARRAVSLWKNKLYMVEIGDLMTTMPKFIQNLSDRLLKKIEFKVSGGAVLVDRRIFHPVMQSLVHIIRNAADHGIERPEFRGAKPATGTISFDVDENSANWRIKINDDGRGLDRDAILHKALKLGIITADAAESLSDSDCHNLIIREGISTARELSTLSGRGVGVAAVFVAITAAGGTLDVSSEARISTTFTITIPKPTSSIHHKS